MPRQDKGLQKKHKFYYQKWNTTKSSPESLQRAPPTGRWGCVHLWGPRTGQWCVAGPGKKGKRPVLSVLMHTGTLFLIQTPMMSAPVLTHCTRHKQLLRVPQSSQQTTKFNFITHKSHLQKKIKIKRKTWAHNSGGLILPSAFCSSNMLWLFKDFIPFITCHSIKRGAPYYYL